MERDTVRPRVTRGFTMATIHIEGSDTPSVFLARGRRAVVEHTDFIDRLLSQGVVIEVKDEVRQEK